MAHAVRRQNVTPIFVCLGREREHAGETRPIEDERGHGKAGDFAISAGGVEMIVEEGLDPLIDRAKVAHEGPILFATERQKMIHQRGEATGVGLGGEARLADFAELEVEVGDELGVGGARIISGEVGGGGVVSHVEGGGGANRV